MNYPFIDYCWSQNDIKHSVSFSSMLNWTTGGASRDWREFQLAGVPKDFASNDRLLVAWSNKHIFQTKLEPPSSMATSTAGWIRSGHRFGSEAIALVSQRLSWGSRDCPEINWRFLVFVGIKKDWYSNIFIPLLYYNDVQTSYYTCEILVPRHKQWQSRGQPRYQQSWQHGSIVTKGCNTWPSFDAARAPKFWAKWLCIHKLSSSKLP